MGKFKLQAGDILININRGNDPWSRIRRWAVGECSHVFMYMGKLTITKGETWYYPVPMLFESNGRGVVLQSLSNRYEQQVAVMRLKSEHDRKRIPVVLAEAIKLASEPQAFYDYFCIITFVLLRIICEKLCLPIPLKWQRDDRQICSEAVFEIYYRAKLVDILPRDIAPLPGDFRDSLLLEEVWQGELSEERVS